jgi:cyclopropane-fatty-acyl-phospholipid synthase
MDKEPSDRSLARVYRGRGLRAAKCTRMLEGMRPGAANAARHRVGELLGEAGIRIDGKEPWDIAVHRAEFFPRVMAEGSLGFGDSYVEGWWDCASIDRLVERLWRARLPERVRVWRDLPRVLQAKWFNLQRGRRAFRVGDHHYDIGNDLYRAMLDPRMIYSCGYWERADDLAAAQEAKLELVCRKLQLQPGMRVLDIGCGWGGAARYAAERHGVQVTGVTVSREQAELAREMCDGLPVEIRLCDYRDVREKFDRIFSIGMFEHAGHRNYRTYFDVVRRCLGDDGIFLLHTIGSLETTTRTDPWIARRIFPNSMLPSARQIAAAAEGRLVMEDWHNFGADYDRTLLAWHANIEDSWEALDPARYDEPFRRMWRYYLLSCAGGFRARELQLWQIVFSKDGTAGGYRVPGIR